jgi:hypothetical protein
VWWDGNIVSKRYALTVLLILLLAATFSGCTELVNIVNGRDAAATPTAAVTSTPVPSLTPSPEAFQDDVRVTYGKDVQQPVGIWDHYIVYDEEVSADRFFIHLYNINTNMEQTIATGNVRSYDCIGGEAGNGKIALIFNDANRFMLYAIRYGLW